MTGESPVCNFARCEVFCPKTVMQGFGHLSTKTDATLNWNHLVCEWPCVAPSPERVSKQQERHSSGPAPNLNSTAPCEVTVQSRWTVGMSKWVKWRKMLLRMNSQLWTVQLWTTESPLIGSRQWGRAETNIQIVLVVSTGHRERRDVLAPSLIFCFRNTSLYDTAHTRMYRHPHIHVTGKDIKAHTHSLCVFLLLCRKPWRMLICEHNISYIALTIGWRDSSVVRSPHCSNRKSEFSSTATYNISSRKLKALLWPLWVLHACAALIAMLTHTHTKWINLFKN